MRSQSTFNPSHATAPSGLRLDLASFSPARKPIHAAMARRIFTRDRFVCVYCGDQAQVIDHVLPVAFGGTTHESNLVSACSFCNLRVSDKVFDDFYAKKEYLKQFAEQRERRRRRKLALCGDCGYVFPPGVRGATNVLCSECTAIDNAVQQFLDAGWTLQAIKRQLEATAA